MANAGMANRIKDAKRELAAQWALGQAGGVQVTRTTAHQPSDPAQNVDRGRKGKGPQTGRLMHQTLPLGGNLQIEVQDARPQAVSPASSHTVAGPSRAPRRPAAAPMASQAHIEDEDDVALGTPSVHIQTIKPDPSVGPVIVRTTREVVQGLIDLTEDEPEEAPLAGHETTPAASVVSAVSPAPSVAPPNNVSILDGKIQASPAELPAKVLRRYKAKFVQQARQTARREGREDKTTHERLVGIVRMLEEAKDLARLIEIHKDHGQDVLDSAHDMLVKEHKLYTRMRKQIQESPKSRLFHKEILVPQTIRVSNMEGTMEFCDKLVEDLCGLPRDLRKIKIET